MYSVLYCTTWSVRLLCHQFSLQQSLCVLLIYVRRGCVVCHLPVRDRRMIQFSRESVSSSLRIFGIRSSHASSGQVFPSGHRDVPVRSTISGRSASGVFSESDGSVERDCVFDAHFPRFSRKDHHQPTLSHSIAFKNPTIPERCDFVTRCGSAPTAAVAMTRFQVSREYYYWLENHLRSSFRSDVATTPFVRNVPQTFHACTLSRVDLYISFHLSI